MDGMELLKLAVQIAIGLAAGGFTAAGYFAVITSVGMINRIVDVTNTKAYIPYFEEVIIWAHPLEMYGSSLTCRCRPVCRVLFYTVCFPGCLSDCLPSVWQKILRHCQSL